jgi:nucleoside 2-deoxyribosyltransferase
MAKVAPHMKDSAYVITIAPTDGLADVKIAVEIGYAILLGKPLIVLKQPGRPVAEKLLRIADYVIEGDMDTEVGRESVQEQLKRVLKQ